MGVRFRIVKSSEIAACPQHRWDPQHWIPRHKTEQCMKNGLVRFKHEDFDADGEPIGPVRWYEPGVEPPVKIPFGAPLPAGITDLGWMTLKKAKALARKAGARFEVR